MMIAALLSFLFVGTSATLTTSLRSFERGAVSFSQLGSFEFTLTNDVAQDVTISKWFTPFDNMSPAYYFEINKVASTDKAIYLGRLARRFNSSEDELTIPARSRHSVLVNLKENWALPGDGTYEVRFLGTDDCAASNAITVEVKDVPVHKVFLPVDEQDSTIQRFGPTYTNCDTTARSAVDNGQSSGTSQNNRAVSCLKANSCSGYTTWYGARDSTRYNTVTNNHVAIQGGLSARWIAHCYPSGCPSNVYAYVYPSDTSRTIYLCNVYFQQRSCQGPTIVHEMSHFSNVARTQDYAYGESACKSLASSNPSRAIANADNVCYFAKYA